jgi:hypothetical protein
MEESDAPSTDNAELDLQSHENTFSSTATRQFFVDGKSTAWRKLGPEIPTISLSTTNPFLFGEPESSATHQPDSSMFSQPKQEEPCKHETVVGVFCQDCGGATKSLFGSFETLY